VPFAKDNYNGQVKKDEVGNVRSMNGGKRRMHIGD
jgi:hypothetical protein